MACPDAAVWTQVKPDALHRRLSHSAAQVGSYLFISGGHDGSEYTPELLLFNLGQSAFSLCVGRLDFIRSFTAQQCHYSTSPARGSAARRRRVAIMLRSSLTHGSSSLAGSTDTTSLTTCTSSTSP